MKSICAVASLSLLVFCGCPDTSPCRLYHYADQFDYEVRPEFVTPDGITVDATGQAVSPELIDWLTTEVEDCLRRQFGNPPVIPDAVRREADCWDATFDLPISRGCLTLKLPDDWLDSCDGLWQLLPAPAPDELCRAKGIEPTPDCPCRWRTGLQDQLTIVTTPDLRMYADPLVRLATGCNNPWHPALAECADVSVGLPLGRR